MIELHYTTQKRCLWHISLEETNVGPFRGSEKVAHEEVRCDT